MRLLQIPGWMPATLVRYGRSILVFIAVGLMVSACGINLNTFVIGSNGSTMPYLSSCDGCTTKTTTHRPIDGATKYPFLADIHSVSISDHRLCVESVCVSIARAERYIIGIPSKGRYLVSKGDILMWLGAAMLVIGVLAVLAYLVIAGIYRLVSR